MKKEWFVGIDVSKKWLDVAIFVENSDFWSLQSSGTIPSSLVRKTTV